MHYQQATLLLVLKCKWLWCSRSYLRGYNSSPSPLLTYEASRRNEGRDKSVLRGALASCVLRTANPGWTSGSMRRLATLSSWLILLYKSNPPSGHSHCKEGPHQAPKPQTDSDKGGMGQGGIKKSFLSTRTQISESIYYCLRSSEEENPQWQRWYTGSGYLSITAILKSICWKVG